MFDMGREIRDWAKYTDRSKEKERQKKRRFFKVCLLVLLSLVLFRFYPEIKQFFDGSQPLSEIIEQPAVSSTEKVRRKNIYDRRLNMLAASVKTSSIYVKPREFEDIATTVGTLATLLSYEESELLEKLKAERNFTWLSRNISPEKAQKVKALNIDGVYFHDRIERIYPAWSDAPQFVGQVKDDVGLSGIEFAYNDTLLSGRHLILTLDLELQTDLEKLLETLLEKIGHKQGGSLLVTTASGIIMDAKTREIIASALVPSSQHSFTPALTAEDKGAQIATVPVKTGGLYSLFRLAAAVDAGLRRTVDAESDSGDFKILAPRGIKKRRQAPSTPWWSLDEKKNIVSPWLASITEETERALGEDGQFVLHPHIEKEFFNAAKFRVGSNDTSSALHILNSFATLVSDGRSAEPHILLSTVTDAGEIRGESVSVSSSTSIFSEEESKEFRMFLEDTVPPGAHFFIVESLQKSLPGEASVAAREFAEHGGEIIVSRPEQDSSGHGQDISAANDTIDLPPGFSRPDVILYEGAILAAAPLRDPKLVMLISFNQGMIDVTRPSGMEKLTISFLQKALRLARNNNRLKKGESLPEYDAEELLVSWEARQNTTVKIENNAPKSASQIMPDLHGLSLRRALRILQPFGCRVTIEGSGTVQSQHPKPGSKIVGDECVLSARDRSEKSE
ncbi:MAG: PASTA domain-containing protein [Desulfovibrionaceae bacterium]|nr:PASTA domain-containing protein [Desulfovibrionaceae bacterium]